MLSQLLLCAPPCRGEATDGWSQPALANACAASPLRRPHFCGVGGLFQPLRKFRFRFSHLRQRPSTFLRRPQVDIGSSWTSAAAPLARSALLLRLCTFLFCQWTSCRMCLWISFQTVFDCIVRLCFSGQVGLTHASPPRKEYSRLKLRPGGPSAIRSPEHLGGLPTNSEEMQSAM